VERRLRRRRSSRRSSWSGSSVGVPLGDWVDSFVGALDLLNSASIALVRLGGDGSSARGLDAR